MKCSKTDDRFPCGSCSAMKNSPLNLNTSIMNSAMHKQEIEGNGISSTERESSPCSPSPRNDGNDIKSEPMELMCSTNQVS